MSHTIPCTTKARAVVCQNTVDMPCTTGQSRLNQLLRHTSAWLACTCSSWAFARHALQLHCHDAGHDFNDVSMPICQGDGGSNRMCASFNQQPIHKAQDSSTAVVHCAMHNNAVHLPVSSFESCSFNLHGIRNQTKPHHTVIPAMSNVGYCKNGETPHKPCTCCKEVCTAAARSLSCRVLCLSAGVLHHVCQHMIDIFIFLPMLRPYPTRRYQLLYSIQLRTLQGTAAMHQQTLRTAEASRQHSTIQLDSSNISMSLQCSSAAALFAAALWQHSYVAIV